MINPVTVNDESSGFHLLEIHLPTAITGGSLLLILAAVAAIAYCLWKRKCAHWLQSRVEDQHGLDKMDPERTMREAEQAELEQELKEERRARRHLETSIQQERSWFRSQISAALQETVDGTALTHPILNSTLRESSGSGLSPGSTCRSEPQIETGQTPNERC